MEENYREELDNIEEIVQDYIDGVIEFNFEKAEKSWHAEGVKIYYDNTNDSLEKLTMVQSRPEGKPPRKISQRAEIKEISRVGKAATVLIQWYQEKEDKETIFTDFLSLLKMNNQWKIVAKITDIQKLKN